MFDIMKKLVLMLLMFAMVSCADNIFDSVAEEPQLSYEGDVELRLGVPATRATLDEGLNLRWQRGDRIYFMAYAGSTQLFGKEANFWANVVGDSSQGNSQAYFKTKFNAVTESDVIESIKSIAGGRCYAISPIDGVTLSGTTATMTLPSVQTGEYSSAYDLMTARSSAISSLTLCTGSNKDYINDINLVFAHHTHAFRVVIPANNLGKEITKAYLKFPFAVVGDVTVDFTTGAVTLTNTSDLVTVEFTEPKGAGDEFWVFINGVENRGAVDLRFQAADGTYTERRTANFTQKNWSAGSISKISMSVPRATTLTTLKYTIASYSNLGEPITNLHLTLPAGYYFSNFKQNATAINNNGEYQFTMFNDIIDGALRGSSLYAVYESEHAYISSSIKYATTTTALTVPYLYEENFATVGSFSSNDNYTSGFISGDKGAHSFLNGWSGGRIGASAGLSIRMACRRETSARYGARVDSAPITNLKKGASVRVKVVYDYGMDQDYGGIASITVGQTCYEGRTTDSSALSSGSETGTFDTNFYIEEDNNASWSSIPYTRSYSFDGCTSATRLSWRTFPENKAGANNNTCWLYLDNIRVSIAQ